MKIMYKILHMLLIPLSVDLLYGFPYTQDRIPDRNKVGETVSISL